MKEVFQFRLLSPPTIKPPVSVVTIMLLQSTNRKDGFGSIWRSAPRRCTSLTRTMAGCFVRSPETGRSSMALVAASAGNESNSHQIHAIGGPAKRHRSIRLLEHSAILPNPFLGQFRVLVFCDPQSWSKLLLRWPVKLSLAQYTFKLHTSRTLR